MAERLSEPGRPDRGEEGGFTVVEVLIALLVLLIGMAGILSMQLTSAEATSFSRHATEASVLGEDKMEVLRTAPAVLLVSANDKVDALGVPDVDGFFTRVWDIVPGTPTSITVTVSWQEQGTDPYQIVLHTLRTR